MVVGVARAESERETIWGWEGEFVKRLDNFGIRNLI